MWKGSGLFPGFIVALPVAHTLLVPSQHKEWQYRSKYHLVLALQDLRAPQQLVGSC